MVCNCLTMCRVPEMFDTRYPMPNHHPNCEEYKLEIFAKVTHDGITCIMEVNEAVAMVAESEETYEICNVYLTRDQFENMQEFTGF